MAVADPGGLAYRLFVRPGTLLLVARHPLAGTDAPGKQQVLHDTINRVAPVVTNRRTRAMER